MRSVTIRIPVGRRRCRAAGLLRGAGRSAHAHRAAPSGSRAALTEPNAAAHGYALSRADGDPHSRTPDGDSDAYPHGNAHGNADADAHGNADADADGYAIADSHTLANSHTLSDSHAIAYPNRHNRTDGHGHAHSYAHADLGRGRRGPHLPDHPMVR